jgi:hypothetical protein
VQMAWWVVVEESMCEGGVCGRVGMGMGMGVVRGVGCDLTEFILT